MRKVVIANNATPPNDWLEEAEQVTAELYAAKNEDERKAIIERNERLWRDDRIRNWLLAIFHNKCWYTEAKESVSAIHVDHYRPKGRVTDLEQNEQDGYWWLAFDWTNYRMCGQLINVKKRDVFPVGEGDRANWNKPASLKKEATVLIDPITDDARLISYEIAEDGCLAVELSDIDDSEKYRATTTIEVLGLNRIRRLKENRAATWRECCGYIADYLSASNEPQCLKVLRQSLAIVELKKLIDYEKEFSSVAEACIRNTAPEVVKAKVYG